MILIGATMNLNKILDDLSKYKNNSNKEEVLKKYIQIRLTKSLDSYYKELDKSINYFYSRKQDIKMLKKINRRL